jgi:Holliday junction resolvase-like predicted endonuclease
MRKTDEAPTPQVRPRIAAPARVAAFHTGLSAEARASLDEAAQTWLMAHPEHADFDLRFDVMLIAPRCLPRHLLAAFDSSS